jgi:predicted acetyltransferase
MIVMDFDLTLATADDAHVFLNLWPLYQYDISEVGGTLPNAHGVFEDDPVRTADYAGPLRVWFHRPGFLFPYLIRVDGRAAGFAMLGAAPAHAPKGADFFVHEFFILRPFRRHGLGERVMHRLFAAHPGQWELWVLPENTPALHFWRRTIARATSFIETREYKDMWESEAVVFRFDTRSE